MCCCNVRFWNLPSFHTPLLQSCPRCCGAWCSAWGWRWTCSTMAASLCLPSGSSGPTWPSPSYCWWRVCLPSCTPCVFTGKAYAVAPPLLVTHLSAPSLVTPPTTPFLPPEGRPGMSDVTLPSEISGLSFDSPFLSPLLFFLPSPLALSV